MPDTHVSVQMAVGCFKCEKPLISDDVKEIVEYHNESYFRNGQKYVKVQKISIIVCKGCAGGPTKTH